MYTQTFISQLFNPGFNHKTIFSKFNSIALFVSSLERMSSILYNVLCIAIYSLLELCCSFFFAYSAQ